MGKAKRTFCLPWRSAFLLLHSFALNKKPLSEPFPKLVRHYILQLVISACLSITMHSILSLWGGLLVTNCRLFQDAKLDALALWKGHAGFVALSNNDGVGDTGGKFVAVGVLKMHNVEPAQVSLSANHRSDAACVTSSHDRSQLPGLEFDEVDDLACVQIDLD
mmetsp:Transcript_22604/g.37281  ORF Transcript_22604/g.37281 Transcript_22604/m.37281 type:complete len:163 (-) Transcript_22604:531-1019(-)